MKFITVIFMTLVCVPLFSINAWAQESDLIFSHKLHAVEVEAACSDCHQMADTSRTAFQNLLPDMETCYNCHDQDAACTMCHKDPDNAEPYPRITNYIAKFPHLNHVSQNLECSTCHSGIESSETVFDKHLPAMNTCISCHNEIEQVDYCYTCHGAHKDLQPSNHRLDWTKIHGMASQTDDDCKMCHSDNQCLDCHQKDNLDRKVHRLNFRNNHGILARGNKENCYTCHEELSFCVDCHRQEMVMPRTHASAGWSNTSTGGRHARAAQQDLDSCISCHNENISEPICMQCH